MKTISTLLMAGLVVGVAAVTVGLTLLPSDDDPTFDALCAASPILVEEAFLENRVSFNWTGTTGQSVAELPVQIPGYTPGPTARMEEMRVDRGSIDAVANAAIGRGRAWAAPVRDDAGRIPPELWPPRENREDELIEFARFAKADCRLDSWMQSFIRLSKDPRVHGEDNRLGGLREHLEVSADDALIFMQEDRQRCLQARWAPRSALPLRAFRSAEFRPYGAYVYALSPHIVTRGDEVVYFSMGVVRESRVPRFVPLPNRDAIERVCCVTPFPRGGCSRYGGPDPYLFHVRGVFRRGEE